MGRAALIVDTSALLAIVLDEAEADRFAEAIMLAPAAMLPSVAFVEACLRRLDRDLLIDAARITRTVAELDMRVEPFTMEHAALATVAIRRFGRGRHPAALNYADCMVYAVAKLAGAPLLYKGADFARTDLVAALAAA